MISSLEKAPLPADGIEGELAELRAGIDAVDSEIQRLLNKRAEFSLKTGRLKAGAGVPVFHPDREQALLAALEARNTGPLPALHLKAIYGEILSSSRALQEPLRVAFLGPEGTFSHMAAREYFGSAMIYEAKATLHDVFDAVEKGDSDLGMVPLENSLNGSVGQSLDLFASHRNAHVQAEWSSRIRLSLMSGARSLAEISVIYSHPQALGQCALWLRENLPSARQVQVESTAAAAHRAVAEAGSAAVGHAGIAPNLGLRVLASGIEDIADNWTRFFIIGPRPADSAGANRSSLVFALADQPGSLAAVLNAFAAAKINMSKLESRPMRHERWKYLFFADVDCNLAHPAHASLLESVRSHCHSVRVIGSYLSAVRDGDHANDRARGHSNDQV